MKNVFTVKRGLRFTLLFFALSMAVVACRKENLTENVPTADLNQAVSERNNTVVDIAVSNPDFSILVAGVLKTELAGLLSGASLNGTVFAPNNAAFQQLPFPFNSVDAINSITDPLVINQLRNIIRYHVVVGARTAAQLTNGQYNTRFGAATPNGGSVFVGRSIAGEVFVNGVCKVIAADIAASNGVIHVIDRVLLPPTQDIYMIARGNSNFSALVAAIKKTGLVSAVQFKSGNYTVFAPTDAAFAQLPAPLNSAANIRNISDPATINLLRNVLQYHVLGSRVFSVDLREGISAPTVLAGNNVSVTLVGGPKVKGSGNTTGSNIILTNILATNGVIHAIDQVLLP